MTVSQPYSHPYVVVMRVFLLSLVFAVLATTVPSSAVGQDCQGRPGASAVEQYCEAIPDATGKPVQPSSEPSGSATAGTTPIGRKTGDDLRAAGTDGKAVLTLAGVTSPSRGGSGARDAPRNGTSSSTSASTPSERGAVAGVSAASEPSASPLRAVSASVQSGRTVGGDFLWVLAAVTLIGLAAGWLRFRARRSS